MSVFIISLLMALSPTPQEEKPALPPIKIEEKVVQNLQLEPILFVKVVGKMDITKLQEAVSKMGAAHNVETLLMYSEELVPVLMPRKELEKHKEDPNYINAESFIQKMKEELKKQKEEAKPKDKET